MKFKLYDNPKNSTLSGGREDKGTESDLQKTHQTSQISMQMELQTNKRKTKICVFANTLKKYPKYTLG